MYMVDYNLLIIAQNMPDHATPPARMSGGDRPKWDADMETWDFLTVRRNPRFISPHTLMPHYGDPDEGYAEVRGLSISGMIGG